MDAVFYWEMTYIEIQTAIDANQRRIKQDMQIQASMVYKLGELVTIAFNDPNEYPKSVKKVFPNLFDDVKEGKQQDWRVIKARMENYSNKHNARMKAGENN